MFSDAPAQVEPILTNPVMKEMLFATIQDTQKSEIWHTASGRKLHRRGKKVANGWKCSAEERKQLTETTIAEWKTLTEEERAIVVSPPEQSNVMREATLDRIVERKFVHTATQQPDHSCKYKSRWCAMENGVPDCLLLAEAGATASPTASSSSRTSAFQAAVSNRWPMTIGDVKAAFFETG